MAFIKTQKLIRDENGNIKTGSASIIDTQYVNQGSYHARHSVREKLGKVLWLSEDKNIYTFANAPLRTKLHKTF